MTRTFRLTATYPKGRTINLEYEACDYEAAKDRAQSLSLNNGCYVSIRKIETELVGEYFPEQGQEK